MKILDPLYIALVAFCFAIPSAHAATQSGRFDDGDAVETRLRKISYQNTTEEFMEECNSSKTIRVTPFDFEIATKQAQTFMAFLTGPIGNALLDIFTRPGMLENVIQKGIKMDSTKEKVKDTFSYILSCGMRDDIVALRLNNRGSFVIQQFLEHHSDELRPKRNLNLLRAIFQSIRLYYLARDPFESADIVENHKFGLKPVKVLSSINPSDWKIENDEICFAMYGIFKILEKVYYFKFDNDEQELIDFLLTPEERARIEEQITEKRSGFYLYR